MNTTTAEYEKAKALYYYSYLIRGFLRESEELNIFRREWENIEKRVELTADLREHLDPEGISNMDSAFEYEREQALKRVASSEEDVKRRLGMLLPWMEKLKTIGFPLNQTVVDIVEQTRQSLVSKDKPTA